MVAENNVAAEEVVRSGENQDIFWKQNAEDLVKYQM